MVQLAFAISNGLSSGMAVFLVAAGVTLIYGILKILNFSHGAFFMMGAYVAFSLTGSSASSIFTLVAASVAAGIATGACGYLADKVILQRLRQVDEHYVLIATFALMLFVTGAIKLVWGLDYHAINPPTALSSTVRLGGIVIPIYAMFISVVGLFIFLVLDIGIHRLWIGKVVQTLVNDSWMLGLFGYNVPALYTSTVILSFFLAGLAGGLLLPNQSLSPTLGDTYILWGFVAVIIGGLGSVRGAFVASLAIGLVDSVSVVAFSNFPGLSVYVAMVIVLLVRPQGLFGSTADQAAPSRWGLLFRMATLPAHVRALARERPRRQVAQGTTTIDFSVRARGGRRMVPYIAMFIIAGGLTLPYWGNQGLVFVAGLTLIEAFFALSWHFLFAYAGVLSFGHAAFYAVGAYGVGACLKMLPSIPFLGLLTGTAVLGAAIAWIVGIIALRRSSGIYLAILTMALAEICRIVFGYSDLLGRDDGLSGILRPDLNFPGFQISLHSDAAYYYFLWVCIGLLTALVWWVAHSRLGRALRCIHQDPERASFIGINVGRYRLWSFVLSGALAAVSGGLAAPWTQIVTPDAANVFHSTQPILNTLLGGVNSFWGPMVGAAAFAAINFWTRTLAGLSEVVVGFVLLVIILVAPNGLIGLANSLERQIKRFLALPTQLSNLDRENNGQQASSDGKPMLHGKQT